MKVVIYSCVEWMGEGKIYTILCGSPIENMHLIYARHCLASVAFVYIFLVFLHGLLDEPVCCPTCHEYFLTQMCVITVLMRPTMQPTIIWKVAYALEIFTKSFMNGKKVILTT